MIYYTAFMIMSARTVLPQWEYVGSKKFPQDPL